MAHAACRRRSSWTGWRCLLLAVSAGLASARASAQDRTGVIVGTARDSAGQAIVGVEIGMLETAASVRTDARGVFRFLHVPAGTVTLRARRIGFRVATLPVVVDPGSVATVEFRLKSTAFALAPVLVRSRPVRRIGRLAGFYERLQSHIGGHFITRERLAEGEHVALTDVLRRVPGLEIVRGGRVRMRGRPCSPLVWIDGVAMPAAEVDLNTFRPSSLEGVEIYPTASGAPLRYQTTMDRSRCGTILLWSRGPDSEQPANFSLTSAEEFEQRHADRTVFTAADVDSTARLDSGAAIAVAYPPELLGDRVRGSVLVEVVVDSGGRTEEGSFGIVYASHELFARAAWEALRQASFRPAILNGRHVAQIVQIPFRFEPPTKKGSE